MMMRQGPNNNNNNKNRGRGRGGPPQHGGGNGGGNRRPQGPNRNQNFDSNGPDVRIRGSAYQVFEKYLNLARDATAAGDRVMAESYYQHAEHYHRVINVIEFGEDGQRRPRPDGYNNGGYNNNGQNQAGFGGEGPTHDQNGDQNGEQGDNNQGEGQQQREDQPYVGEGSFPPEAQVTSRATQTYSGPPPETQDQPDLPAVPQRREFNETDSEEQFGQARSE